MYELALFAGAGGGILGGVLLGWRTIAAVEINPFRRDRLLQRQAEGYLPGFPVWSDVRSFTVRNGECRAFIRDLRRIRHRLVISAGFPCQDVSAAGRGEGIRAGRRSGLWREVARIVGEIRPALVFAENSPRLDRRGLDIVLSDLAAMGYDARWCVLGAWHAGAPHYRNRIWILAYAEGKPQRPGLRADETTKQRGRRPGDGCCPGGDASDAVGVGRQTRGTESALRAWESQLDRRGWWAAEPPVGRMAYGVADGMEQRSAIGDGQVPIVAAIAFNILSAGLGV